MKFTRGHRSVNFEDRRGGGGRGVRLAGGAGAIGLVIALAAKLLFGVDLPIPGLGGGGGEGGPAVGIPRDQDPEAEVVDRANSVLDDLQATWAKLFQARGARYEDARLVAFRDLTPTACGTGQSAMGPFYCPGDQTVFIDLSFFQDLDRRFGAPGDFAQAYVLAHEIGHHVQRLMGTEQKVRALQERNPGAANELSVRMELQADCYAGVWAKATANKTMIEPGDLDEGLGAAAAIGDDRLQRRARGRVVPESFTHGSSAQRVEWFKRGLASGDPDACDTFRSDQL